MNAAEKPPFTAQDFLDWEYLQPAKHEFMHCETFAMASARDAHVTVSLNVVTALKLQVESASVDLKMPISLV